MPILPYINLPQNNVPDLLNSIGDTLVSAAQRKKQQEKEAADLLLRQQTQAREDRLATAQIGNYQSEAEARKSEAEMRKAQEKRITDEETRRQHLEIANALPNIRQMLIPGSPTYDPQTAMSLARAHGIELTATQPAAPVEPKIGPTQVEYGARETPEIAQQAALERSVRNVPGDASPQAGAAEDQRQIALAEQERQRFAEANDPEAVQRNKLLGKQYADQVAAYRTAQPTYSGTSPIGPVNIDPNAALESQRFALEENKRKMAPLMNIPGMEKYAPGIQAAIASGAKPEQVNALVSKAIEDARKDDEKAQYSLTAEQQIRHQKAMEAAAFANAGARQTSASNSNDTAVNRDLSTYLGQVKEFENTAGVNKDVAMMKNIGKIHEELNHSPASPVAQAAAVDTIAQIAQGGKASVGVMNTINAHTLGPLERAYDKAYQVAHNGAHSPAWVKSMSDTLAGLKNFAAEEQQRVMKGFEAAAGDESLFNGPEYSKARDSQRRKIQAAMGMEVAPERPAQPGALQPGTGKRPAKENPLTRAAKGKPQQAPIDDLLKQAGF